MFVTVPHDLSELTADQLEAELVELAAQINAATCRWLELAAEFERRRAHEEFGFASCATWLAWRCSLTPRAAREQLRVGRSLAELPKIRAEFASGRLSYSKARALTRVATNAMEGMEDELIELAQDSTASQLERLLRAYRTATAEDDALAADRRHLTTWWDDDGMLRVSGSLPADEGALLLKALEISRDELFASYVADAAESADASAADPSAVFSGQPPAPDRADGLLALAETVIAKGVQAASGDDRHQVVVHVDATPGGRVARGGGSAEPPPAASGEPLSPIEIDRAAVDDVPLSPETTRRLACDASIVTLVEANGEPLSVGRKTRSIPPAIRRALAARDRCCAFPGCEQERFVDAHHLVHWANGGETSLDNLVLLCRRHHRLVHEGGVTIEGDARSPSFRRADGTAIEPAPPLPAITERAPLRRIAAPSDPPWGRGEPMDLDLAVFVLADLHERRRHNGDHGGSGGSGGGGGRNGSDQSSGSGRPPPTTS